MPVLDTGQELALRCGVAAQLVSYEHAGHVVQATEQLAEEPFGCIRIAPALDQDVEHVAVLVHRAPK